MCFAFEKQNFTLTTSFLNNDKIDTMILYIESKPFLFFVGIICGPFFAA